MVLHIPRYNSTVQNIGNASFWFTKKVV